MENNKNMIFACELNYPIRCDKSKCYKCGFNPIEKARRKAIINKEGLSIVKKINGKEYYGLIKG